MTTPPKISEETLPDWVRAEIEKRIGLCMLELPLLPSVAAEALDLCMARDGDAEQMANILHRDQALAGNVLRVANSPLFGASVVITSLQQAVSRVGINTITEVVLSVVTKATIFETPPDWSSCVHDLPRLSLVSGLYARHVARACDDNADTAFLSGFMHDVGWPAVMLLLQKIEERRRQNLELPVVQAAGDMYHAEVGAELARSWGVAEGVVDAICHHENWNDFDVIPAGAPVVSLADQLARVAMPEFSETAESVLEHPALDPLDLESEQVRALLDMGNQVLKMADAII